MAKTTKCDKVTTANDKNVDSDKSKYNPRLGGGWWEEEAYGRGWEGWSYRYADKRSSWAPYTAVDLVPVSVSPGCLRDLHPDPG